MFSQSVFSLDPPRLPRLPENLTTITLKDASTHAVAACHLSSSQKAVVLLFTNAVRSILDFCPIPLSSLREMSVNVCECGVSGVYGVLAADQVRSAAVPKQETATPNRNDVGMFADT